MQQLMHTNKSTTQFELLSLVTHKLQNTHALFVEGVRTLVSCDETDCTICNCRYELPQTTQTYPLLLELKSQLTMNFAIFSERKLMYLQLRGNTAKAFVDLLMEKQNPLKFMYQINYEHGQCCLKRLHKIKKTERHSQTQKHNPFSDLPDITLSLNPLEITTLFHRSSVYSRYLEIKNEIYG